MEEAVLMGLDFGSTTSHAMVARAPILRNCVTGRMEVGAPTSVYRSEPVFTPYDGERIDDVRLGGRLDAWLSEAAVDPGGLTSASAIVTGLAAQAVNASAVSRVVRDRVGDALIAVADDPHLESWLAFKGSCLALSRAEPETPFLNLDIGGGTTNLALGRDGEVSRVGCLFVGARHVRVTAGSYRVEGLSRYASAAFERLGIARRAGDVLRPAEVDALMDFFVGLIESTVLGDGRYRGDACARLLTQVPYVPPLLTKEPVITLSGGVGELAYRQERGEAPPAATAYGDLGIELALRIRRSPLLSRSLKTHVPENLGRATVCGLTLHNLEVSGATLFLRRPETLPLRDLPILARLSGDAPGEEIREAVSRASRTGRGACLQFLDVGEDHRSVRALGGRLAEALRGTPFPDGVPLVLLVPRNVGKSLGQYATDWGGLAADLIVIDEVSGRDAHFVSLGALRNGVVPVSFYGLR